MKLLPLDTLVETKAIWKALSVAHRNLAELKGICETLPNPQLLMQTLALQEAKDSSEIENIITTHSDIYLAQGDEVLSVAAKEVQTYAEGLTAGWEAVRDTGLIRLDTILNVQRCIEHNRAGLRAVPGTVLKSESTGDIIYTPPQGKLEVERLMNNLVEYIHSEDEDLDPLIKMAIVHHQFESIHPFYDGNGRTGRILNILMLIRDGLLNLPILYLSRYINQTKEDYYRLLQAVREEGAWEAWCLYILEGITQTAIHEKELIKQLRTLMSDYKQRIRGEYKFYSQDLLNNLFRYPYTKIDFLVKDLSVSRPTASKYLEQLAEGGFLRRQKVGKTVFYVNQPLFELLSL